MKIIKRSGAEAVFDISKIIIAINKANHEVVEAERLTADQIKEIAQYIEDSCKDANHALNDRRYSGLSGGSVNGQEGFFCCPEIHYLPL